MVAGWGVLGVAMLLCQGCARKAERATSSAAPAAPTALPLSHVPEGCVADIVVPWGAPPPNGGPLTGIAPVLVPAIEGGACRVHLDGEFPWIRDVPPTPFGGTWGFQIPAGYVGPVQCRVGDWVSPRFDMMPGALWPAGMIAGAFVTHPPNPSAPNTVSFGPCDWGWTAAHVRHAE